jgi:hypothetical protein
METEKSANKRMVQIAAEKIHSDFSLKYSELLKSSKLLNLDRYTLFKKKIIKILSKTNLLSPNYSFKILLSNIRVRIQGLKF